MNQLTPLCTSFCVRKTTTLRQIPNTDLSHFSTLPTPRPAQPPPATSQPHPQPPNYLKNKSKSQEQERNHNTNLSHKNQQINPNLSRFPDPNLSRQSTSRLNKTTQTTINEHISHHICHKRQTASVTNTKHEVRQIPNSQAPFPHLANT